MHRGILKLPAIVAARNQYPSKHAHDAGLSGLVCDRLGGGGRTGTRPAAVTGTVAKEGIIQVTEPNASTITERMAALKQAHNKGLRTYGMLCPLLPGVSDSYEDILEMVGFVKECGAKEIFAEAVNPRGRGLILTAGALREHGYEIEAEAVDRIRKKPARTEYVLQLIQNVQKAMRKVRMAGKLRYLLYGSDLTEKAEQLIRRDDAGVVWL